MLRCEHALLIGLVPLILSLVQFLDGEEPIEGPDAAIDKVLDVCAIVAIINDLLDEVFLHQIERNFDHIFFILL